MSGSQRAWGCDSPALLDYLNQYQSGSEARSGLGDYFSFYNTERIHSSLGYQTPEEVYFKERCKQEPEQALSGVHLKSVQFLS